jgi:hypothetical protein
MDEPAKRWWPSIDTLVIIVSLVPRCSAPSPGPFLGVGRAAARADQHHVLHAPNRQRAHPSPFLAY